jgi:hypothetical protein
MHGWFMAQGRQGQPLDIPPEDFRVAVVTPDGTHCRSPVVQKGRIPGMFLFAIAADFLAQAGDYTVGILAPRHKILPVVRKFHVVH